MKQRIQQLMMGSSLPKDTLLNTGWLLFRLHIGLSIAIHAGWPKMNTLAAPGWFNDQVAGLGFTFPSPAFWATLASWGEFVGGIGIALGLLTRFNAFQLAFQFFVISFIWFDKPEPLTGMYFQQTLFWAYVLTVFAGSGRFSIDHLLLHRKKSAQPVVVKTAIACLLVCLTLSAPAQNKALTGSGKVVTKKFALNGFDKLDIRNMDGLATIEIGKPFGVEVVIDDNLESLLEAGVVDGMLRVELKGNSSNRLYIENTQIRVNITMPEISVLRQNGNNDLRVNGIIGRYFRIEHSGNGNAILKGRVDELDIRKAGNGNLDAAGLVAGKANLKKQGNGDLLFNTNAPFAIEGSGNGDMINKGNGRAIQEKLSGNGRLQYLSAGQITRSRFQTSINDFKRLTGTWKGQLTYLDYTSNKNVSMEANTLFEMVSDSSFDQFIYYTDEPHKNADSRYTIRENGRALNEMKLVERKEEKGKLLLVFEYRGPDGNDNRMATMQRIMELSGKVLTSTKMVKYDGEDHFIQRHQYRFSSSLVQ